MILYKSKIQCPNCEGCGKTIHPYNDTHNKRKIKTTVCSVCNGNGFITGDIKILVNEEQPILKG